MNPANVDLSFVDFGSVAQVRANTGEGMEWLMENTASEPWQWCGPTLCVEPRYTEVLAEAALDDGLAVEVIER
jgi:hypothetical protein